MKRMICSILLICGLILGIALLGAPGCGDPCSLIEISTVPVNQICQPSQRVDLMVEITADPEEELSQITYTASQGRQDIDVPSLNCTSSGCTAAFCSVDSSSDLVIEVTATTPTGSCTETTSLSVSDDPSCVGICNL